MMANTRSARKRVRTSEKNRIYNRYWTTRCKTSAKKVLEAINSNDPELALKRFNDAQSALDKAVVKGVIHRNMAARKKSRLTKAIRKIQEQA